MTLIQQRKNTALRALFNAVTRKKFTFASQMDFSKTAQTHSQKLVQFSLIGTLRENIGDKIFWVELNLWYWICYEKRITCVCVCVRVVFVRQIK